MTCACCGFDQDDKSVAAVRESLRLTKIEGRVFDRLARNFGREVLTEQLIDAMYFDDPNGGPATASNVLSITVMKLRVKIGPRNLKLDAGKGAGAYRRLRWSTQQERAASK